MSDTNSRSIPENPDQYLEGWNGEDLPPTFHAYAWRLYNALVASQSSERAQEPVLDKKAQIGATVFGVGVKWSTVIDRAQREWGYYHGLKNPKSGTPDIEGSLDKDHGWPAVAPASATSPHNFDPKRDVACTKGEYAALAFNARRYEWLRDNMRRMPMGEAGARHFFDQPGTMSFQEAVDDQMERAEGTGR